MIGLRGVVFILGIGLVGCTHISVNHTTKSDPSAFELLKGHNLGSDEPITGSYEAGAKIFVAANPEQDAEAAFKKSGPQLIYFCGFSCSPVGIDDGDREMSKGFGVVYVPASTDYLEEVSSKYLSASAE